MRLLLGAALLEGVTGIGLIGKPALLARMLFGAELSGAGIAVGRFAGTPLLTMALMCCPQPVSSRATVIRAFFTYNLLASLLLAYIGIRRTMTGVLLWPAVVIHATLALLFSRQFRALRSGR